jgi:hypothetical protein
MSGPSEALRARVIADDLAEITNVQPCSTWHHETIGMLRRYAALIDAVDEIPAGNWLKHWLPEGKLVDVFEMYRLFQQRLRGRAQQITREKANG